MIKKQKFLAISDVHGDITSVKSLAENARNEGIDGIFVCGDFSSRSELDAAPPYLFQTLSALKKPIFLLHGNHETQVTIKFLEEFYKVKNLHGYYAWLQDLGIFGAGGAEIGPFPTSEAEIYAALKAGFSKVKNAKKKIMVTHAHPAGSLMEKFVPGSGSTAVRRAIEAFNPDILLCGHMHEAAGIEEMIGKTRVINVAKKGKIIEV